MIRFLIGMTTGFTIAYLTAPGGGKQIRSTLVNFIHDELEGVSLIGKQWHKTVSRAKAALDQVKETTGYLPISTKPKSL